MTSINEKLGFKRAGKRKMMNLPAAAADRTALTSAQCPACGQRGVVQHLIFRRLRRLCSWCGHAWTP